MVSPKLGRLCVAGVFRRRAAIEDLPGIGDLPCTDVRVFLGRLTAMALAPAYK